MKAKSILFTVILLTIQGCNPFESTFDKQVKACVNDAKLSLGDPESLEVVSSEGIDLDNGWFRVKLNFTAKNSMGGRVRGDTICGFKNKNDTALNPEDFMNQKRELARNLKELGIR
jgi:hypothetical protein